MIFLFLSILGIRSLFVFDHPFDRACLYLPSLTWECAMCVCVWFWHASPFIITKKYNKWFFQFTNVNDVDCCSCSIYLLNSNGWIHFCNSNSKTRKKHAHTTSFSLTISKLCEELYLFYFLFPLPTKKSIYKFIIRSIFPFDSFFSLPSALLLLIQFTGETRGLLWQDSIESGLCGTNEMNEINNQNGQTGK